MTISLDPVGGMGDFPKVATGEYPFVIDEVHVVQFDGEDHPKARVFFNLGVTKTVEGEDAEVRLTKYFKPSLFTGSMTYPTPAGWVLLCRAIGVDPRAALADMATIIGGKGIATVVRTVEEGKNKNKIESTMPLGTATAPQGIEGKGVTDKRNALDAVPVGASAAVDPNW